MISPEMSSWLEKWQYYLYASVGVIFLIAVLGAGGFFSWFHRRIIRGGQLTLEERLKQLENCSQVDTVGDNDNDDN